MAKKKAQTEKQLKFIRLRNPFDDDLLGYVVQKDNTVTIEMPLRVMVETIFEEGRQILSMQEYLPQSIVNMQSVDFDISEIHFMAEVKVDFVEQYEYVSDFFYNNEPKIKSAKKKESVDDATKEKVVSILEALATKKDKPVH
jgi:hypothetical protein